MLSYSSRIHWNTFSGVYEKFANAFAKAVQDLEVGNGLMDGVTQVLLTMALHQITMPLINLLMSANNFC